MIPEKLLLGDLLVQHELITPEQLSTALHQQETQGGKLGDIVVQLGYIDENSFLKFYAEQLKIPFTDLRHYTVNPEIVNKLPELYARHFRAIVLDATPTDYLIGMVNPQDILAYDELARILKRPLRLSLVREPELLNTFDLAYRRTKQIAGFAEELSEELASDSTFDLAQLTTNLGAADAPVVKLLQSILEDAVQINASDIHIEPDEKVLRIRQRVDGVLQEQTMDKIRIAPALIQRLKLMANLNIAEKRLPQDGRFSIKVKNHVIDIRVATMPVQYGESLVMRLLDTTNVALHLDDLGMPAAMLKTLHNYIHLPHGMILVTGPTGSGKTTTLYSILAELNSVEKKIITVEDPVEYRLARINQVQVNSQIELDFARVLRTALRHDPDIIMVGEIRDQETSSIALRAAITGHLVLATMHTNDALSSAMRLLDLGSAGYLVAAGLRIVIGQRLLRRICDTCKETRTPTDSEIAWLEAECPQKINLQKLKQGAGCSRCNNTGYRGRVGIFEMLEINNTMQTALRLGDTTAFIQAAKKTSYKPLAITALDLVEQGVTTLQEIWRVTAFGE